MENQKPNLNSRNLKPKSNIFKNIVLAPFKLVGLVLKIIIKFFIKPAFLIAIMSIPIFLVAITIFGINIPLIGSFINNNIVANLSKTFNTLNGVVFNMLATSVSVIIPSGIIARSMNKLAKGNKSRTKNLGKNAEKSNNKTLTNNNEKSIESVSYTEYNNTKNKNNDISNEQLNNNNNNKPIDKNNENEHENSLLNDDFDNFIENLDECINYLEELEK